MRAAQRRVVGELLREVLGEVLGRSYRPLTLEEIKEDFLGRIGQTLRICTKDGMELVIRDHSHTDFCMGEAAAGLTPIRSFLGDNYALVSAVTVRHPLDSYLGLLAAGRQRASSARAAWRSTASGIWRSWIATGTCRCCATRSSAWSRRRSWNGSAAC